MFTASLANFKMAGLLLLSLPMTSSTASLSFSFGTTLLTNPSCKASSAEMKSPVRISSLAFFSPTSLGNIWVPPPPGITPTLISGCPNWAFSAAMIMSQAIDISVPPPTAIPFTMAMTGLGISLMNSYGLLVALVHLMTSMGPHLENILISAPALKALSPAPVMTMTYTSSSSLAFSSAATTSPSKVSFCAFNLSGRLNVIQATLSFLS